MRQQPLVLATGWNVSTTHKWGDDFRTLSVYRFAFRGPMPHNMLIYHPVHNGRTFATDDEADAYCLSHGLLKEYRPLYRPGC